MGRGYWDLRVSEFLEVHEGVVFQVRSSMIDE